MRRKNPIQEKMEIQYSSDTLWTSPKINEPATTSHLLFALSRKMSMGTSAIKGGMSRWKGGNDSVSNKPDNKGRDRELLHGAIIVYYSPQ
jgi:hypothetical protein